MNAFPDQGKHHGTPPWEEDQRKRREQYLEKPLPSSEESERVILGAILLDNLVMNEVIGKVSPEDFYSPFNKRVYAAMTTLFENHKSIDPIMVGEELKKEGSFESMGGVSVITNLTFGLPHFSDVEEYVDTVVKKSKVRQAIRSLNQISSELLAEEDDPFEVMQKGADSLVDLMEGVVEQEDFKMVSDMIDDRIQHIQHVQQTGNPITGLPTGFTELDLQLGGLQRTDLVIIGGRPSMGKTAFGFGLAQNGAFRHDVFVAVFTIEMSDEQLVNRAISSEAGVDGLALRSGLLSHNDWERIDEAKNFLKNGMLALDDSPTLCPSQVRQKLRRLAKQKGKMPDLVIIDYIQLMNANPGMKFESRQQEMTKISRELKQIAKKLDITIVALSQLSRAPEGRAMNNHRPMLGDLRESGAIEQDADVVLFIYREEMYPKADGLVIGQGEAEIIIGKQRNGPTGTVKLYYDKSSTKFGNYLAEF